MPELLPSTIAGKLPLDRLLVLVAHPDDESVGCATMLQRAEDATVVFATDGAPQDRKFWPSYSSRAEYAQIRRGEAIAAAAAIGIRRTEFLNIPDQELFRHLREAHGEIANILQRHQPAAILTHAYEGGHPDHDACSFLAFLLGRDHDVPIWEIPLYHRAAGDRAWQQFIAQRSFLRGAGEELVFTLSPGELLRKRAMVAAYKSQGNVLKNFDATREVCRLQPEYDFTKPPHAGTLNYEEWHWPMTGRDVADAFRVMLSGETAKAQGRSR